MERCNAEGFYWPVEDLEISFDAGKVVVDAVNLFCDTLQVWIDPPLLKVAVASWPIDGGVGFVDGEVTEWVTLESLILDDLNKFCGDEVDWNDQRNKTVEKLEELASKLREAKPEPSSSN